MAGSCGNNGRELSEKSIYTEDGRMRPWGRPRQGGSDNDEDLRELGVHN